MSGVLWKNEYLYEGEGRMSYYPDQELQKQAACSPVMAITPTLKQRLEGAVNRAEEQLTAAKEARELFDRNPDIEKLLNLMQRGLF
jgi:hypothetical protein